MPLFIWWLWSCLANSGDPMVILLIDVLGRFAFQTYRPSNLFCTGKPSSVCPCVGISCHSETQAVEMFECADC